MLYLIADAEAPHWSNFKGEILIRGTQADLENESLQMTLYDVSKFFTKTLSTKVIGLRGVVDSQTIKSEMYLRSEETGDKYDVKLQGSVVIQHHPKYRQSGS